MLGSGTGVEIAADPDLAMECLGVLPILKALAITPATPEMVMVILRRRFAVYPQPDRTEGAWTEWWSAYLSALKDCSEPAIEAAMDAYVKLSESDYFPKPGRIFALAKTKPNDATVAYSNARAAEALINRGAAEARQHVGPEAVQALAVGAFRPRHAPTPAERKAVSSMAAQMAKVIEDRKASRPKPPQLPPVQGKVDGSGITPEMRELLGLPDYLPTPAELLESRGVELVDEAAFDPAVEEDLDAWPT